MPRPPPTPGPSEVPQFDHLGSDGILGREASQGFIESEKFLIGLRCLRIGQLCALRATPMLDPAFATSFSTRMPHRRGGRGEKWPRLSQCPSGWRRPGRK